MKKKSSHDVKDFITLKTNTMKTMQIYCLLRNLQIFLSKFCDFSLNLNSFLPL